MVDIWAENQKRTQILGNGREPSYELEARAAQGRPAQPQH